MPKRLKWTKTVSAAVLALSATSLMVVSNGRAQVSATATVDFNGDGRSDILWRQNTGTISVWLMDGGTGLGGGAAAVDSSYRIFGTGDHNGDR